MLPMGLTMAKSVIIDLRASVQFILVCPCFFGIDSHSTQLPDLYIMKPVFLRIVLFL